MVAAGDIEDLHTLDRAIPRELAAIAMRAMAARSEARYPSAAAFAEDLRRFQAGRMVSAHSYSLREIFGLWWRRHRVAASVAAVAAGALALTIVVAFVEVREEQREALRNLARAEQAERAATINLQTAETAVLQFLAGIADDPRLQEEDHLALRKQLLAGAIPLLQQLTVEGPASAGFERVRGQAFLRLAELCLETGDYVQALASAREAAALFAGLQARNAGESGSGRDEVTALRVQVKVLAQLARRDERDALLRRAVELAERLTAADPGDPELAFEYARALNDVGLRDLDDDPARSSRTFAAMREVLAPLVRAHPDEARFRQALVGALGNTALGLSRTGDRVAAVQMLAAALDEARALVALQPRNGRYRQYLGSVLNNLANGLRAVDRAGDADRTLAEALALRESLAADFPSVEVYGIEVAETRTNFGNLHRDQGQWDEALAAYAAAIDRLVAMGAGGTTEHLRATQMKAYGERAALHQMRGEFSRAAEDWRAAAAIAIDAAVPHYRVMRATALLRAGSVEAAVREVEEVLRAEPLPRLAEFGHPLYRCADFHARLAALRGDPADARVAEALLARAVAAAPEDRAWLLASHELTALRELVEPDAP